MTKSAIGVLVPCLVASCATAAPADRVPRISPREAHERVEHHGALLVCAYCQAKCPGTHLAGSISLEALEARLSDLPPDREIILFCG